MRSTVLAKSANGGPPSEARLGGGSGGGPGTMGSLPPGLMGGFFRPDLR